MQLPRSPSKNAQLPAQCKLYRRGAALPSSVLRYKIRRPQQISEFHIRGGSVFQTPHAYPPPRTWTKEMYTYEKNPNFYTHT